MIKKMKTGKYAGQFQVRIQPINKVTGKVGRLSMLKLVGQQPH